MVFEKYIDIQYNVKKILHIQHNTIFFNIQYI